MEKELSVLRKREELTRKEADTSSREKGLQLQASDFDSKVQGLIISMRHKT